MSDVAPGDPESYSVFHYVRSDGGTGIPGLEVTDPVDLAAEFGGRGHVSACDVCPDGSLWLVGDHILRIGTDKGRRPQTFTSTDPASSARWLVVGPDGPLWIAPVGDFEATGTECDGLLGFDGGGWRPFLDGLCIIDIDISPDGTLWVQTDARGKVVPGERKFGSWSGLRGTYVIRPEVAMADQLRHAPSLAVVKGQMDLLTGGHQTSTGHQTSAPADG